MRNRPQTNGTGPLILILPNGQQLLEELANSVRRRVLQRIPELDHDRNYTLRQICGEEFWQFLEDTKARKCGIYIAYLVTNSMLPLEFATCPHAVPKRYRLK